MNIEEKKSHFNGWIRWAIKKDLTNSNDKEQFIKILD